MSATSQNGLPVSNFSEKRLQGCSLLGDTSITFPENFTVDMLAIHRDMRPIEGLRPILSATDTWR